MSAPSLQECTNRHADGIMSSFGVTFKSPSENPESGEDFTSPATPEEFAVLAIHMQHDTELRKHMIPKLAVRGSIAGKHGKQLLEFARSLVS